MSEFLVLCECAMSVICGVIIPARITYCVSAKHRRPVIIEVLCECDVCVFVIAIARLFVFSWSE